MKAPFKMKAGKEGPMKKNFGIGSPVKDIKKSMIEEVTVSGGKKTEGGRAKFERVKTKAKSGGKNTKEILSSEYGGTWTKKGTSWRNQDGQTVKEAGISQSKAKATKRKDYIKANKTN